MERLDYYKLYTVLSLDLIAVCFFLFAENNAVSTVLNCMFAVYLLLTGAKALVNLQIIEKAEKKADIPQAMYIAVLLLQHITFTIFALSVVIYCVAQIIFKVA